MNCISGVRELLTQANGSTFPPKATRYGGASTSLVRLLTWSFQRSSMGLVYGGFQKGFLAVGSKGSPRSFEAGEKEAWRGCNRVVDGGKLPKRQQAAGKTLLCEILSAETRWEAERRRDQFARWCVQRGCPTAAQCLEADWERMVTCCRFPRAHWQHLRTTNSAESPFAAARLRTRCRHATQEGVGGHRGDLEEAVRGEACAPPTQPSEADATGVSRSSVH